MSLEDRLRALRKAGSERMDPEKKSIMDRAMDLLRQEGAANRVVRPDTTLPAFALPNQDNELIRSDDLLRGGPLVLTIYRGVW